VGVHGILLRLSRNRLISSWLVQDIRQSEFMKHHPAWRREVETWLEKKEIAEIQSFSESWVGSESFLSAAYLPRKLQDGMWL
jgi:DNA topoisomerase VI subunit A